MKKVFFAFVAVATLALVSCNNKPAEGEGTTTDTVAVEAPVEVAPVEAAPVDSVAVTDTVVAK